jgi:hypothetical protein
MAKEDKKTSATTPPETDTPTPGPVPDKMAAAKEPAAEPERPQLTAAQLYQREQAAANLRWVKSQERREAERRIRRRYAMFYWSDESQADVEVNLGEISQPTPRMVKAWTWLFVCEAELDLLRDEQNRGNIGLVVLPEKTEPGKLPVDKANADAATTGTKE